MDDRGKQIIAQCIELFLRYGVRSLTMDDFARHLGISKKTLYQYVTDKDDLVRKGIELYLEKDRCEVEQIRVDSSDAIDEMIRLTRTVSERIREMHPSIMYDVQKYHPEAFAKFMHYKQTEILGCIERNMQQGVEQGLYRNNLNIPIVARFYASRIDVLFDAQLFPPNEFDQRTVFLEHMRYHIRAIASERGIEVMKERFRQMDGNNSLI